MPELAEVQTFVNAIRQKFLGLTIEKIQFHRADLRYPFDKTKLNKIFAKGAQLHNVFREGKQLVFETSQGAVNISLGMSGSFKAITNEKREVHQHVSLFFSNGSGLGYVDSRRFGFWKVRNNEQEAIKICDPLFAEQLRQVFAKDEIVQKSRAIKEMLMDQKIIGGIGNIYALEALYLAKISPFRPCYQVKKEEWLQLATKIPQLLQKAIELGGSSISSYKSFGGSKGAFQDLHQVYGRSDQKCLRSNCNGSIKRESQNGRSSWYCNLCQR